MKSKRHYHLLWVLSMIVVLCYSCKDEEESVQGFEVTSLRKQESDSSYTLRIHTGKVTSSTTVTIRISGSAIPDADFTVNEPTTTASSSVGIYLTPSSLSSAYEKQITIAAGETYADFTLQLIDDKFVEPKMESIDLQITDISDSAIKNNIQNTTCEILLTDNDVPPSDALQVDLSWYTKDGSLFNTSDFDLYLAKNVVVSKNQVLSKELVDNIFSTSKTELESIKLGDSLPDGVYYVLIHFSSGTADSAIEIIASQSNDYSSTAGLIQVADVGKDFYYGPITKSGNSFSSRKITPSIVASD